MNRVQTLVDSKGVSVFVSCAVFAICACTPGTLLTDPLH